MHAQQLLEAVGLIEGGAGLQLLLSPPSKKTSYCNHAVTVYRAVKEDVLGGGAETKVGAKPLDKAAQGVGLGGIFRLLPCQR